jgi:hypothetical protein
VRPYTCPLPILVQVHQQVSLVLTHDACIGSLLLTILLNPSPRTAFLLADHDALSQQLHTLRLLATHVSVVDVEQDQEVDDTMPLILKLLTFNLP